MRKLNDIIGVAMPLLIDFKNEPLKKIETFQKPCHKIIPYFTNEGKITVNHVAKWLVASYMTRITATNSSLRSFTCTLFQMKLFRGQAARYRSNSPRKE